jgi:hypothetical protein
MRLELSESEARLAWEALRAMGALGLPDGVLAGSEPPGESATVLGMPASRPSGETSTTTTAAAGDTPSYDSSHADAETVLGLPAERRAAAPPATRDE